MKTYRKAEAIVEDYNRDLAEWERQATEGKEPAKKERPPERESFVNGSDSFSGRVSSNRTRKIL